MSSALSRLPGAAIPFLCLLSVGPGAANAAYTCTGLGFECLDRIYTGAAYYARARAPTSSLLSWKRPANRRTNGLLLGDTLTATRRHRARRADCCAQLLGVSRV